MEKKKETTKVKVKKEGKEEVKSLKKVPMPPRVDPYEWRKKNNK